MCVAANHATYTTLTGQERKKNNLQFMFLTQLPPWNKVKVINLRTPGKVLIIQSLKDFAKWCQEKANRVLVKSEENFFYTRNTHDQVGVINTHKVFNLIG